MLGIQVSQHQSPILTDGYEYIDNKKVMVTAHQRAIGMYSPEYILYLGPKAVISKYSRHTIQVEIKDK